VLNRVTSSQASSILGSLQSNGQVFLINPDRVTACRISASDRRTLPNAK
jgi:filamentous hemagglutinin family protein